MKRHMLAGANRIALGTTLLCSLMMACNASTPEPEATATAATPSASAAVQPATFIGQQQLSMAQMAKQPWFGVLESVDAHDLFSYLSGSFLGGGHAFPVLYFDPAAREFWVKGPNVATKFGANSLDEALGAYTRLLVDKGYDMPNQVSPKRPTVAIDGKEMVVVSTAELFPSNEAAKSHFSSEQWQVLYSKLGGWQGFTYLSGLGDQSRDYPLLVGLGWQDTARLRVLGPQTAEAFEFDSVEQAFDAYRKLVSTRIAEPAAASAP